MSGALTDRPTPPVIDDLTMKHGFSDAGARDFLKVYDATISFAGVSVSDKMLPLEQVADEDDDPDVADPPPPADTKQRKAKIMEGERELTTGLLSKGASFRLIVSGEVGVREIERLIAKLKLDKEICRRGRSR